MSNYTHQTIHCLLESQASAHLNNLALTDGVGVSLNYSELLQIVDALILDLHSAGVDPGDRVSLVMPNGTDLAIALLAVGSFAVAAPLNPLYKKNEFESYFSELRVKWLVLLDGYESPAIDAAHSLQIGIIRLSRGSLKSVGEKKRASLTSITSIAAKSDDVCLMLLTSGSTGRSKKVPLTHRNVLVSTAHICETLLLSPADKCLCMWEQFHIGGLVDLLLVPLASGGSTVCAGAFNAQRLFELIDNDGITWFQAVPTTLLELTFQAKKLGKQIQFPKLRFVRSVASTLSQALMEEIESLFQVPVLQTLGMTEAGPLITTNRLSPGGRKACSVGLPAGPEIKIAGQNGEVLPQGHTGRIMIRGENVFAGYEDASAANKESFRDGWFDTGDTGYFDEDGFLFLKGRTKEMINRGGEKITPQEIDDVLHLHPRIAQAAAFSVQHKTLGEDVAVAVVMKPGQQQLTTAEVRTHVAQHLAGFKVPQRVFFLNEMPRDPVGKINRLSVATQARGLTKQGSQERDKFHDLEQRLAKIWAAELGLSRVGPGENFFEIGGDSLTAMRVLLAIEEEFSLKLSPEVWTAISSVREMAKIITRDVGAGPSKSESRKSDILPENYDRLIQMVMNTGQIKIMPNEPTIKIINPDGSKIPLAWVFNAPDREMTGLAGHLNSDQPLLGLYSGSRYLLADDAPETIAEHYADRLQALYPQGGFYLAGNCRGGIVTHKILNLLNARDVFPKRVMFVEYIDESLFDYAGEVTFLFGKQSHMLAEHGASIAAAEKLTNSTEVRFINGQHGQFFHPENVVDFAREILAFLDGTCFKAPQRAALNEMPRDPVGTINRPSAGTQAQALTKQDGQERDKFHDLEQRLAKIWASELGLPQVGPNENFFEIGGDSLTGMRVLLAIEEELSHKLSPEVWTAISSVREMAKIITRDIEAGPSNSKNPKSDILPEDYDRTIQMVINVGHIKAMPNEPTIKIINPDGSKIPLVWVFNAPDREMTGLAGHLNSDQPLLGLYSGSRYLLADDAPETIAEHYADRLQALYPQGGFYLAGSCRGGVVAHKILKLLNARGIFPKRVMFLEYIDKSLFDYAGEVMFVFGKQSDRAAIHSANILAALRNEKRTSSMKVRWVNGRHGEFFYPENAVELAREVVTFLDGTYNRVKASEPA